MEWISVEDKMPNVGQLVLGINGYQEFILVTYDNPDNKRYSPFRIYTHCLGCRGGEKLTHWTTLPEKPK